MEIRPDYLDSGVASQDQQDQRDTLGGSLDTETIQHRFDTIFGSNYFAGPPNVGSATSLRAQNEAVEQAAVDGNGGVGNEVVGLLPSAMKE